MKKIIVMLALLAITSEAFADRYILLTSQPGRNLKTNMGTEKLFSELVTELFARAELKVETKQTPWVKAQSEVKKASIDKRLLIAPLSRTPEREEDFDWIVPLAPFSLQFVSTDKTIDMTSFENLKKETVCVWRESPAEYRLRSLDFPDILGRVQVQKCYKDMRSGKQKLVLAHGEEVAKVLYSQVGGKADKLKFSRPFGEYTVYLAATPGLIDEDTKRLLNNTLDSMKIDGTYSSVFARNGADRK